MKRNIMRLMGAVLALAMLVTVCALPVGALAEGRKAPEGAGEHPALPEPVLVFCGVGSAQLDRLLQALRKLGLPRTCLKAVLTGENAGWTFSQLYEELTRERSALSRKE